MHSQAVPARDAPLLGDDANSLLKGGMYRYVEQNVATIVIQLTITTQFIEHHKN